jgi:Phytanoyl-CoA dioxygenase (PhyH)
MEPKELPNRVRAALDTRYPLSPEQRASYRANRCVKLPNFWSPEVLAYFEPIVTNLVGELTQSMPDLSQRDTYGKAFRQAFNLWMLDTRVREWMFSPRIKMLMQDLLECSGVRMYHDQALYKEPGGGITPWHADQYYWPMDSDRVATIWMPLHAVPNEMGPLNFAQGSHILTEGRQLEIGEDSEARIGARMRIGDFPVLQEPYGLGEVSVHSGWVFHRASIYMDAHMRASEPVNAHQSADLAQWSPGVAVGELLNSPLNPPL